MSQDLCQSSVVPTGIRGAQNGRMVHLNPKMYKQVRSIYMDDYFYIRSVTKYLLKTLAKANIYCIRNFCCPVSISAQMVNNVGLTKESVKAEKQFQ